MRLDCGIGSARGACARRPTDVRCGSGPRAPGDGAALSIDFRTPHRAAYCDYAPKGELGEGNAPIPRTDLYCWTPNDGFYVDMYATGRVFGRDYEEQLKRANPQTADVLGFGERWSQTGFRCISRRSGLTCRNDGGHGWWLGRFRGYRIF